MVNFMENNQSFISNQYNNVIFWFADFYNRLKNHEGFKRYLKNTGWMFVGQMLNMGVAFFIGAMVARYLGPEKYGILNYAVSFSGLFAFLSGFGIDAILNRELIKFPERRDILIGNGFWIKFIGGIFAVAAINISAFFIPNSYLARILIFLFSLTFLFQVSGVLSIYFQSQVLAKKLFQMQVIVTLVSTIFKLLVIYFNKGVIWLTLNYVLDAIVSGFILWYFYKRQENKISWSFDKPLIILLLKNSWPLMFVTVATSIYMKIDQTMIKLILSDLQVGIYAVAVKLSEIWYFIPNIICASLFPAIVNAKKTGENFYFKRLGYLYKLMFWLSLGIAVFIFLFSKTIILIIYGQAYLHAVKPLQIYAWAGVPVFLTAALMQYLITEGYSKVYFVSTVLGAFVNIALNLFFIPKFGIVGSAWATVISYCIPLVAAICFKKIRREVYKALWQKQTASVI